MLPLELVRNRMVPYVLGLPGVARDPIFSESRPARATRGPCALHPAPVSSGEFSRGCEERSSALDPFQALVAIIAIVTAGGVVSTIVSTIGKALSRPAAPEELTGDSSQIVSAEQESTREAIAQLSSRLERLEEERDFYKDLLDSPAMRREIPPPDAEEDASDTAGRS